jgi:hypothetical protein
MGATAAQAAGTGALHARVTTNKGCLETGDAATFVVGEKIAVFLTVHSSAFSRAHATLFSIKPSGPILAAVLGHIFTNVTYGFSGRVGPPSGVHKLELKASAGYLTSRRSCSFNVVGKTSTKTPGVSATPTKTRTRTKTPTATPTRTPTPTKTPSVVKTHSKAVHPRVWTNRGCKEKGDDAKFYVGESIIVSYRIDSDTVDYAQATLLDILPGGFANVLRNRIIETNRTFSFKAVVSPPTGHEELELRASAYGFKSVKRSCTFEVLY